MLLATPLKSQKRLPFFKNLYSLKMKIETKYLKAKFCQKLSEAQFVANLERTAANIVLIGLARSKSSFVVVEYTGIGNLTARKSYHLELSQIIKNGRVFVLTKYRIRTKLIKWIYKHGVLCFIGLKLELSILKQSQFLLVKRPNNNQKLLDSKEITFSQFNMRAVWCFNRLTVSISLA